MAPHSKGDSAAQMVLNWAERTPEALAVCQGDRCWTYAQLASTASNFAKSLPAGKVVAVTGQRSFGLVASMLAVLWNNILLMVDPNLPEKRQQLFVSQSQARHLMAVGRMPSWMRSHPWDSTVEVDPDLEVPVRGTVLAESSPEDPAYIFFTSGSTGMPKGVLGTQKGLSHFLVWQSATFQVGPGDRVGQLTSLSFDVVLRSVFLALVSGGALCLPTESVNLAGSSALPWMEHEKITVIHSVPSLVQAWLTDVPTGVSLPKLRLAFFAGEPLNDSLVRRWRKNFPTSRIVNLYGPTETTLAKFFYEVPKEPAPGVQPAGWPLPETEGWLLNEEGVPCAAGAIGEIVIRTPFRTLGYINAPEEQQRRFICNPFKDDPTDVLYRTGDLGRYRADGALEILGRLDYQLKIQGVRIEPDEISAVIAQHPRVHSCVVVARARPPKEALLVAYIVGPGLASRELREYLSAELPVVMIPAGFVFLESLPLNHNGKVDRNELPVYNVSSSFIAPRTELERTLAVVWKQVLGVDSIGLDDNFFEAGGNSLLLLQLNEQIQRLKIGYVPITEHFQHPTIRSLADYLTAQTPRKSSKLSARQRATLQIAARTSRLPGKDEQ